MNMSHCPPPPLSLTQLPLETMKQCDTLNMFFFIQLFFSMNQGVQGKCITNKATHTNQDNSFFKGKGAAWVGLEPTTLRLLGRVLFLLSYQGRQGSKSTTQHNTRQSQTPILRAMAQIAQKNPHLVCVMISGIPNYGHIHSSHYAHVVFPYVLRMSTSR